MTKNASSAPATRADVDEMIGIMRGFMNDTSTEFVAINERFEKIDERFEKIDERFEKMDMRLFNIESRLEKIELEIIDLKKSMDHLTSTVDAIIARIDTHETEMAARDAQFQKLLAWAQKVSKQTGIPLEGF